MEKINFKKDRIPFTQVANAVLNDPKLSAKAKGLYAYLYSKPDGWDFAIDRITKDFSDGRLSINTGLQELEANGYLIREKQTTGRVIYLLKSQMSKIDIRELEPDVENRKLRKPQIAKTDTVSNKDKKEIKSLSNKELKIPFNSFYSMYPVKKSKKKAEEKWNRLSLEKQNLAMADLPERMRKDSQWLAGYIPHPTTYINGELWEDEIQVDRTKQTASIVGAKGKYDGVKVNRT